MAKSAVTVTLIFFFIAVSYARTSLDLPESDINPSIHLPTEKPDSDPIIVPKSEITDPKPTESNRNDLPSSETYVVNRVTLTKPEAFVRFRPINRHFNAQREFGLRLPLRRCRHLKKGMNLRFHGREVPYGNHMILSGDSSESDLAFRGVVREIPARWVKFHHHGHHDNDGLPKFPFEHHRFGKEKYKRQFKKEVERDENGFMKKIRKFLKHF